MQKGRYTRIYNRIFQQNNLYIDKLRQKRKNVFHIDKMLVKKVIHIQLTHVAEADCNGRKGVLQGGFSVFSQGAFLMFYQSFLHTEDVAITSLGFFKGLADFGG